MDDQSIRQTTIRDLQSGFTEYRSLLTAQMNADQRYRQLFDCYGVLRLRSCDLINFFAVIPAYFEVSPWGRAMTADPIEFTVDDFGPSIEGTHHSFGTEHAGDTTRTLETTNEESPPHQEHVSDHVKSLVRNGHEILAIDQDDVDIDFPDDDPTENAFFDDASRPDIVSRKDGRIYCHEIEVGNKSKPAKLLTNLARAAAHGYSVIVVTPSRSDARQKYINENDAERLGPILEPYRDCEAEGVICYTLNATVTPSEQVTILLPSGVDTSRWRRTPDDRHELLADGEVIAEGPADKSVDTYSYSCPRVRKQGSGYVLESASGEKIREQSTEAAAIGDLTPVRKPFTITRRQYLTETTVMYKSGDQFTEFAYQPEWALAYQNSNSRRYEAAAKAFIERMTVESDGDTIRLQTLRQAFLEWYTAQTDLDSPNDTWFGRAVNATYDVDDSDTHNKRLENRRFRFSNGILSPDLPFVDEESDGSEESNRGIE